MSTSKRSTSQKTSRYPSSRLIRGRGKPAGIVATGVGLALYFRWRHWP